jgi:hypothetical protein
MQGYLLFVVPMLVWGTIVSVRRGIRQAFLDLIAFNMLFAFDFAALLPGSLALYLVHVLALIFALAAAIVAATRPYALQRHSVKWLLWIGALMAWILIAYTIANSEEGAIGASIQYVIRVYGLNSLYAVVGVYVGLSWGRLTRFIKVYLFACVCAGLISFVQFASGGAVLTSDFGANYLGIFQPLGDRQLLRRDSFEEALGFVNAVRTIQFAGLTFYRASSTMDGVYILLAAVSVGLFYYLLSPSKSSKVLFIPFLITYINGFLGLNRTAIAISTAMLAVLVVMNRRSLLRQRVLRRWAFPAVVGVVAALLLSGQIAPLVLAAYDAFLGDKGAAEVGTLNGRSSLWTFVGQEIGMHPVFGSPDAITSYQAAWAPDDNPENDIGAHNSYLEMAYRFGLPAGIAYTLLCVQMLLAMQNRRRQATNSNQKSVYGALFLVLFALALLNFTASGVSYIHQTALFWLCGGIANSRLLSERSAASAVNRSSPHAKEGSGALVGI